MRSFYQTSQLPWGKGVSFNAGVLENVAARPRGFVDIHAHVLPGIDDGPSDGARALALMRAAAEAGTTTLAATPHLRSDFPDVNVHELAWRCAAMRSQIERESIEVRLVGGAEVSLTWALEASSDELVLATYDQRG